MQGDTRRVSILIPAQKAALASTYKKILDGGELIIDTHCTGYSLHHLLIHLAEELQGGAIVQLSTFSISEEVLNAFQICRDSGLIESISVCIDKNFATKTVPLLHYAGKVFNELYLVPNHTKIAVISKGNEPRFLVTGSANLNYNPKWEYYLATANKFFLQSHLTILDEIKQSAEQWK